MKISANIRIFILSIFILVFFNCNNDDGNTNSCITNSTINCSINLGLAAFNQLNFPGGWAYYNGSLSGTRGLILVNDGGIIKAYDRNAPHICPGNDTTLEVVQDILIECPADGAQWILTTGEPVAVANRAPISYFTRTNGSILLVTN